MPLLILIIPVLAAALWVTASSLRFAFGPETHPIWRGRTIFLMAIGIGLGVWCAFSFHKEVPEKVKVSGFPVPTAFGAFAKEKQTWVISTFPPVIQWIGHITNILAGVAIALLPVKLASFLAQMSAASKKKT